MLGSFFWGYICTELPGGRLAETLGAKRVFGYSMLVSSAITLLTPVFATHGYIAVAVLRTILGFLLVRMIDRFESCSEARGEPRLPGNEGFEPNRASLGPPYNR